MIGARARHASHYWRTSQTLRGHYRRAQPISSFATRRAMPLSARHAIIGPRDTQRAPSSTRRAIIGSESNCAKPLSAPEASIGARTQQREAMTGARRPYLHTCKTTHSGVTTARRLTERTCLRRRRNDQNRSGMKTVPQGQKQTELIVRIDAVATCRVTSRTGTRPSPRAAHRERAQPAQQHRG